MSINVVNLSSCPALSTSNKQSSFSNRTTGMVWTRLAEAIDDALVNSLPKELTSHIFEYFPIGPVQNLGHRLPSYLPYESICDAIKPWGEVQAIMQADAGLKHLFIVKFHRPLRNTLVVGSLPLLSDGGNIPCSPFSARRMHSDGQILNPYIFSQNMIAFDLHALHKFQGHHLLYSHRFVQHRKFQEANIPNPISSFEPVYKRLEETINENEKAEILFCWIREFGLRLLRNGVHGYQLPSETYSKEQIVQNYCGGVGGGHWQIVEHSFPTTVP